MMKAKFSDHMLQSSTFHILFNAYLWRVTPMKV